MSGPRQPEDSTLVSKRKKSEVEVGGGGGGGERKHPKQTGKEEMSFPSRFTSQQHAESYLREGSAKESGRAATAG